MDKDLIRMRQLRVKQAMLKGRLATHELYASKLRSNITHAWDDESKDNVVTTNALLLQEAREDIRACQSQLKATKSRIKLHNRAYESRRSQKK